MGRDMGDTQKGGGLMFDEYKYKVSCRCGNHEFVTLASAREHAEYEMKESVWPPVRWQYTIYVRRASGKWEPYEIIKRVRVTERVK